MTALKNEVKQHEEANNKLRILIARKLFETLLLIETLNRKVETMIREKTPRSTPAKIGVGPEVRKTAENHLSSKLSKISCLIPCLTQLQKKCFLNGITLKWLCNSTVSFDLDRWSILATSLPTKVWILTP